MQSIRRSLSKRRGKSKTRDLSSTEGSVAAETLSPATTELTIAGESRGRQPRSRKLLRGLRGDYPLPANRDDFYRLPSGITHSPKFTVVVEANCDSF
jgi:hypothetical protein